MVLSFLCKQHHSRGHMATFFTWSVFIFDYDLFYINWIWKWHLNNYMFWWGFSCGSQLYIARTLLPKFMFVAKKQAFRKSSRLNILIAECLLHCPEHKSFSNTRSLVEVNIQRVMQSKETPEAISRVQTSQIPKDTNSETHYVHLKQEVTRGNIFVCPYPALSFITNSLTFKTIFFYFLIKQNVWNRKFLRLNFHTTNVTPR